MKLATNSLIVAQTLCMISLASGNSQQNSPVGYMTPVLRRFRLTDPSSLLVLWNVVAPVCIGTCVPLGKYHCPNLFGLVAQHGLLSVMHWSPVLDVLVVSPISVMGMTLLLA